MMERNVENSSQETGRAFMLWGNVDFLEEVEAGRGGSEAVIEEMKFKISVVCKAEERT